MNAKKLPIKPLPLFLSLVITLSIGGIASFFTIPQIKGWYVYLHKPSFNPPNQVFGPVWTVLYILMGIAAYLVWVRRYQTTAFNKARNIYFIQLFFNFCWSIIFFGLHQILAAFVIIVLLWISIIFNIFAFAKISKAASNLLVPYLLWVSFAGVLNFAVYLLNR